MRVCSAVPSVLFLMAFAGEPGLVHAQALSEPVVRSTVPARFEAGDTVRVSFRYELPESVGRVRVRVHLLSGEEVVRTLRRVSPSVAWGSGEGQALEVLAEPVVADGIRVVLSGSDDFFESSERPLVVAAGPVSAESAEPVESAELRRPGWVDPGGSQESADEEPAPEDDSTSSGRVVAVSVDPRLPLAAAAASPRDTLTVQEAIRFSPASLQRLTTQLDRSRVVLPSGTELVRRSQDSALAELLQSPGVAARLDQRSALSPEPSQAYPDTVSVPSPWVIEPDGSMRRTYPDGTEEVVDAAGNRMTCAPEPGSDELRCIMPLFAQIPRVIPSSELATVDVAWLDSMDAWLEQLAADALSEMRTLVADDASIEAYLGLEAGQNLYQRLDQRLEFLNRLIN